MILPLLFLIAHLKASNIKSKQDLSNLNGQELEYRPLFEPDSNKRLISTKEKQQWMTEPQIFELYKSKTRFIDLTEGDFNRLSSNTLHPDSTSSFPDRAYHKELVKGLLENVKVDRMKEFLTRFSSFHTRYFRSNSGKQSAQWLFDQLTLIQTTFPRNDSKLIVSKFEHGWKQFSIIARFESLNQSDDIVVVSAHQDSVNQWNPWFDDDGSGTTTIIETLKVLWAQGFIPKRPIEFHFYSAEEGGLLGSQKVVASYVKSNVKVYGVLHNDMTGYQPDGIPPIVGISTDNVDPNLSKCLQVISEAYAGIAWKPTKCGYACSDHASWTEAKIPAAFTFESAFDDQSPFLHGTEDTVQHISFEHMVAFVNNAIGFAVELSLF